MNKIAYQELLTILTDYTTYLEEIRKGNLHHIVKVPKQQTPQYRIFQLGEEDFTNLDENLCAILNEYAQKNKECFKYLSNKICSVDKNVLCQFFYEQYKKDFHQPFFTEFITATNESCSTHNAILVSMMINDEPYYFLPQKELLYYFYEKDKSLALKLAKHFLETNIDYFDYSISDYYLFKDDEGFFSLCESGLFSIDENYNNHEKEIEYVKYLFTKTTLNSFKKIIGYLYIQNEERIFNLIIEYLTKASNNTTIELEKIESIYKIIKQPLPIHAIKSNHIKKALEKVKIKLDLEEVLNEKSGEGEKRTKI